MTHHNFSPDDQELEEALAPLIQAAEAEARAFCHTYIGTEQLLLGMLHEAESIASQVLSTHYQVGYEQAHSAVYYIIGTGEQDTPLLPVPLTPRARLLLRLAHEQAAVLGHQHLAASHVFLALLLHQEGIAAGVLESLKVPLAEAYIFTLELVTRQEDVQKDAKVRPLVVVQSIKVWQTTDGRWLADITAANNVRRVLQEPTLAEMLTRLYHETCERQAEA